MIFSISLCLILVLNLSSIIRLVKLRAVFSNNSCIYELGLKQLSQTLFLGKDIKCDKGQIIYKNQANEDCIIKFSAGRIVGNPGLVIYCQGIKEASFFGKGKMIFCLIRNNTEQRVYLVAGNYIKTGILNES